MANVQESRNFRSKASTSDLAPIARYPEQILRLLGDPSFYMTFFNSRQAVL